MDLWNWCEDSNPKCFRTTRGTACCKRSRTSMRRARVRLRTGPRLRRTTHGKRGTGAFSANLLAMADKKIKKIRIHPAIGVARLGNSPDKCFLGPEVPGIYPDATKYRDEEFRLKRQAARFRLFAYDEHDKVIGEIT